MTKLVSIIIPAHNMERYLGRCLESLALWLRSDSPVEVLVVNDGSTDRTSEIAHAYADRFPEVVRVIDKINGHYGSAVNAGLAAATGLYVKNLDADDSFDPKGLAALLTQIASDEEHALAVDLYLTDYDEVDECGTTTRTMTHVLPTGALIDVQTILERKERIVMHACAWRHALLTQIDYRQTEGIAYSDLEWILYPMLTARTIRYLPARLYLYLVGREGQSVSLEGRRRNARAWDVLLARIVSYAREKSTALSASARAYLKRVAAEAARMCLETTFVLRPLGEVRSTVERLGAINAIDPGLSKWLEEDARIMKSSFNIRYLRVWRRLPFGKGLWVLFVRFYLWVTRW